MPCTALLSNFDVGAGTLPPEWGQGGSLQNLTIIDLTSTGISGSLPGSWGAQMRLYRFRAPHSNLSVAVGVHA